MTSSSHSPPRRRRAKALTPEERRAALIAATVPLLQRHGTAISTRQIAEAAGVAEGTIFKAFPDKESLIRAALIAAVDHTSSATALAEIDPALPLRERLRAAVDLLGQAATAHRPFILALRQAMASSAPSDAQHQELREHLIAGRQRIIEAVASLFEPDRHRLRRDPRTAAHLLLLLVMADRQDKTEDEPFDSAEIVSLLLDGLLVRPDTNGDA